MLAKKDPKAFYRHVNSKLKTKIGVADLQTDQGELITEDSQRAELFNGFFNREQPKYTRSNNQGYKITRLCLN